MKTVFDTDQCIHVWASQTQPEGRSSKGSVFFEGPALYSYGSHFLMGFILESVAFLNSDSYSVTTSRHQSKASSATRHLRQVRLPDLSKIGWALKASANKQDLGDAMSGAALGIRQYLQDHPSIDFYAANNLGRFFGFTPKQVERFLSEAKRREAKAQKEQAAAKARRELREAEWLADMSDERFAEWRENMYCGENGVVTLHSVEYLQKSAQRAALRLFKARKLAKARRFAKARQARLLARERALRDWAKALPAQAAEVHRAQLAQHFERFRAEYEAAEPDDHARYLIATRRGIHSWQYAEESPERAYLEAAEQFIRERQAIEAERERAERFAKQAEQRAKEANNFAIWQQGGNSIVPASYRSDANGNAFMRRSGDELQTSQGASVPWEHAVKAFRFIKLCKERGETWRRNGRVIRVGHFQVDSIDASGNMVAGCHRFAWEEIERLAKREGVFSVEASAEVVEQRT